MDCERFSPMGGLPGPHGLLPCCTRQGTRDTARWHWRNLSPIFREMCPGGLQQSGHHDRPYSESCGYVRSRISISLVRAASHYLRESRDPTARVSHTSNLGNGNGHRPLLLNPFTHAKLMLSAPQFQFHDHRLSLTASSPTSHATVQQATTFRPCPKHS